MLAWAANRYYSSPHQDFWESMHWMGIIATAHYHKLYKEPELLQHPGFFQWKG